MGKGGLDFGCLQHLQLHFCEEMTGRYWKFLGKGGFGSFGSFGGLVVWVPPSRCNAAPKRCSWPGSEKRSQTKTPKKRENVKREEREE